MFWHARPGGAGVQLADSLAEVAVPAPRRPGPPGTPPPEYEMRPIEPWPPASAATVAPTVEPPPAEPAPPPPAADLPNNEGVPELPDAAVAAAPEPGPF